MLVSLSLQTRTFLKSACESELADTDLSQLTDSCDNPKNGAIIRVTINNSAGESELADTDLSQLTDSCDNPKQQEHRGGRSGEAI